MEPNENDVLSGRGAGVNQHPGNEKFRKMIDKQKDVYMMGTKKKKTNICNAIITALSSMEPSGRFLKQCAETGEWNELSKIDAADRVAQAMAYAVRGKEKCKLRREQLRRFRSSVRQQSKSAVEGIKSPQTADRSPNPQHSATNNHLGSDIFSSSAAQELTSRRGVAVGARNSNASTLEQLDVPGNSHLQQQHLLQHLIQQSSGSIATPTAVGSQIGQTVSQNRLLQLLLESQQQLPPRYTLNQNPLEQLLLLQSQRPLPIQPVLQIGGLMPTLANAQQQQQQQQQLLLQQLMNQQNVLSSTSLPPPILSLSDVPFVAGNSPQLPNTHLLQPLQQQLNPLNDLLLSSVLGNLQQQQNSHTLPPNANSPQEAQDVNQLQRGLIQQRNQLIASTLGASSLNNLFSPFQQQLDRLLQHTSSGTLPLQQQQNSQVLPPMPLINLGVLASSVNTAAQTTEQEGSEDEVQIRSKEKSTDD